MMRALAIFLGFYLLGDLHGFAVELSGFEESNKASLAKAMDTLVSDMFLSNYEKWITHHNNGTLKVCINEILSGAPKVCGKMDGMVVENLKAFEEADLRAISQGLLDTLHAQLGLFSRPADISEF